MFKFTFLFIIMTNISFAGVLKVRSDASIEDNPDSAKIMARIVRLKDTPEESNRLVQKIYDKVEKTLHKKLNMSAGHYSVVPKYEYDNGKRTHVGYETSLSITIDSDDLSLLIQSIKNLTDNNIEINSINPYFSKEYREKIQEKLLGKAIIKAKRKAEVMAEAADMKLKKILRISDNAIEEEPRRPLVEMKSMSNSSFNYKPNKQLIKVKVYIEYDIE